MSRQADTRLKYRNILFMDTCWESELCARDFSSSSAPHEKWKTSWEFHTPQQITYSHRRNSILSNNELYWWGEERWSKIKSRGVNSKRYIECNGEWRSSQGEITFSFSCPSLHLLIKVRSGDFDDNSVWAFSYLCFIVLWRIAAMTKNSFRRLVTVSDDVSVLQPRTAKKTFAVNHFIS